jgi:hypothetical protein
MSRVVAAPIRFKKTKAMVSYRQAKAEIKYDAEATDQGLYFPLNALLH